MVGVAPPTARGELVGSGDAPGPTDALGSGAPEQATTTNAIANPMAADEYLADVNIIYLPLSPSGTADDRACRAAFTGKSPCGCNSFNLHLHPGAIRRWSGRCPGHRWRSCRSGRR